eukprot:scaffold78962_cov42-Phaeocystis_antarctica.AAC.1
MIEALSQGLKRVFRARGGAAPGRRSRVPWSSPRSRCWRMGRARGLDGPQPRPLRLRRARDHARSQSVDSDDFGETIARFPAAGASSSQSGGAQSSCSLHRRALMARAQRKDGP